MGRSMLALPYLLPLGAVQLGDVVANRERPTQRIFQPKEIKIPNDDILKIPASDAKDLQKYDKGAGLTAILSKILRAQGTIDSKKDFSLGTKKVCTSELKNPDDIFASLCQREAFQIWLEKTIKKDDAYFVVGLQIIFDANFEIKNQLQHKVGAGFNPPTDQTGVDVVIEGDMHDNSERDSGFTADGEQIYEIEYRKIAFEMFKGKIAANAYLKEKPAWVSTLRTRDHEDDQPPMIQVSLIDDEPDDDWQVISQHGDVSTYASESTVHIARPENLI